MLESHFVRAVVKFVLKYNGSTSPSNTQVESEYGFLMFCYCSNVQISDSKENKHEMSFVI